MAKPYSCGHSVVEVAASIVIIQIMDMASAIGSLVSMFHGGGASRCANYWERSNARLLLP